MSYDLTLLRRAEIDEEALSKLHEAVFRELRLNVEVSGPDRPGAEVLQDAIEDGEVSEVAFERFCEERQLQADLENEESASRFLSSIWGASVATYSFANYTAAAEAVEIFKAVAERFELVLHDPQENLDLWQGPGKGV